MQKKNSFFVFFILAVLSITVVVLSKTSAFTGIQSVFTNITLPFVSVTSDLFHSISSVFISSEKQKLIEENKKLLKQLAGKEILEKDNIALKDQFKTDIPRSANLLTAKIVGAPGFIPGINTPEDLVLDKGSNDGIKVGQAVVYEDNLIGRISKVSGVISEVEVVTNKKTSFAVKTSRTGALGVLKGQGAGEIILENVLLSEDLKALDIILTKGDLNINGEGYPADLVVGKIMSIEKKPSSLFQSARVENLIDFSKLSRVFVVFK